MAIESVNPATEETLATYDEFTREQVDATLDDVAHAFGDWRERSFAERGQPMRHAAAYLRQHKERFARLITLEMGKPIAQAEAEIEKCAWNCDFYADNAQHFLVNRIVP